MKILWCWRCKTYVPMLDEEEDKTAATLYTTSLQSKDGDTVSEKMRPLLDYYEKVTGVKETNPNVVLHHRSVLYGPPCENCGKPYRSSKAAFCAACGNKRKGGF